MNVRHCFVLFHIALFFVLSSGSVASAQITFSNTEALQNNAALDSGSDFLAHVASDGSGNWVAVWASHDDLGLGLGADRDIVVSRSSDAGITWSDPIALDSTAANDTGGDTDPFVATDGLGNWVCVWESRGDGFGVDDDIMAARSTNNGVTWSAPVAVNDFALVDGSTDNDNSPVLATDAAGTWLVVWNSTRDIGGLLGSDEDNLVARSTDNGAMWTVAAPLHANASTDSLDDKIPSIATDGNGLWIAVFGSFDDQGGTIGVDEDILIVRSIDDGDTWTSPSPLNTNAATDDPALDDDGIPRIATDGNGNWVAVWASFGSLGGTLGNDRDILFARSVDDGVTWSDPAALHASAVGDTGEDSMPEIRVDAAGNWIVVWHSFDPVGATGPDSDIFLTHSVNAGGFWTDPVFVNSNAVTDSSSADDRRPASLADTDGSWMVAWDSTQNLNSQIGIDGDILFARFSLSTVVNPAVPTIDQAVGQADPTTNPTIDFTVDFGVDVTIVDNSAFVFSANVFNFSLFGGPQVYTLRTQVVTVEGPVELNVAAGAAVDGTGTPTEVGIVIDNSVIYDATAPTITILSANPVTIEIGIPYQDAGATAFDTNDGDITASIGTTSTVDANAVGAYTVTYSIVDAAGNQAQAIRDVNVEDTTAPIITVLGDNPLTHEAATSYSDPGATAADIGDGDLTSAIVVTNNVVDTVPGSYTVDYAVMDSSGNTAMTSRAVGVVDTTLPTITILGANPVTVEAGTTYTDGGAMASDSVDGDLTPTIITSSDVDASTPGTYSVDYAVSDSSGNMASASRTVVVEDTQAPTIEILGANPLTHEAGTPYADPGATASAMMDPIPCPSGRKTAATWTTRPSPRRAGRRAWNW